LDWIRKLSRAKEEKSQGLTKEAAALRALRANFNSLSSMILPYEELPAFTEAAFKAAVVDRKSAEWYFGTGGVV
jgi:hypothetical protein